MVVELDEYIEFMRQKNGQIYLRIDVDRQLGVDNIPKLRDICKSEYPNIRRIWYLRAEVLPPRRELWGEEIGLHIDEPLNVVEEYNTLSRHMGRDLPYFTRHGGIEGRLWDDHVKWPEPRPGTDIKFVNGKFPYMRDMTIITPTHTIDDLKVSPKDLKWEALWGYDKQGRFWSIGQVLFHPEQLGTDRDHLREVLHIVNIVNFERSIGRRKWDWI